MLKASPKRPAAATARSSDCDELAAKLFKHKDGRRRLRIVLLLAGTVVACAFFRAHDPTGAVRRSSCHGAANSQHPSRALQLRHVATQDVPQGMCPVGGSACMPGGWRAQRPPGRALRALHAAARHLLIYCPCLSPFLAGFLLTGAPSHVDKDLSAALARKQCPAYAPGDQPSIAFLHIPKTAGEAQGGGCRPGRGTRQTQPRGRATSAPPDPPPAETPAPARARPPPRRHAGAGDAQVCDAQGGPRAVVPPRQRPPGRPPPRLLHLLRGHPRRGAPPPVCHHAPQLFGAVLRLCGAPGLGLLRRRWRGPRPDHHARGAAPPGAWGGWARRCISRV